MELDFEKLGTELRQSADDAHDMETPPVHFAWDFLIENPECFGWDEWPADMPQAPPEAAIDGYYHASDGAKGIC